MVSQTEASQNVIGPPAVGPELCQGMGVVTLGQALAIGITDEPVVSVDRGGEAQQCLQQSVDRRRRE